MGLFSKKSRDPGVAESKDDWVPACEACHSMMDCRRGWQHERTGSGTCPACGRTGAELNLCSKHDPIG